MFKFNAYQLKMIAIIGMFLSHVVAAWWSIVPEFLRFPLWLTGGFTFPIMGFFVVEGYRHTSNLKKYILRILVVGVIALPFHIIALAIPIGGNPMGYPFINIMFAIAVGLLVLVLYDKIKIRALFWLLYIFIIVPLSMIFLEWYFVGVTMVLMYHAIRNETARRIIPPLFGAVCFLGMSLLTRGSIAMLENAVEAGMDMGAMGNALIANSDFANVMLMFPIGIALSALLLLGYNGERGRNMKWLFYIFYPSHLAFLSAGILILGF
ncbi:MAG: conjugal transfer protein TraX [Defluviitaleaceae bacterium]|nr:conjugal transfer protein TraX [Defluviitaleaceae bacterium]